MKKRILTLALALLLMMSMAVPAMAVDLTGDGTAGGTELTYSVSPAFTVTIPANFAITTDFSDAKAVGITAGGKIAFGQTLTISATSANPDGSNGFQLKDTATGAESNYLPYTVMKTSTTGTEVQSGGAILTATATEVNTGKSENLYFKLDSAGTIAGSYKDTVTFTVTVS